MTTIEKKKLYETFKKQIVLVRKAQKEIKNGEDLEGIYKALKQGYKLMRLDKKNNCKNLFRYLDEKVGIPPSKGKNPYISIAKLCFDGKVKTSPQSRYGLVLNTAFTENWPFESFINRTRKRGVNKSANRAGKLISKLQPEKDPAKCFDEGVKVLKANLIKYNFELSAPSKKTKWVGLIAQYKKGDSKVSIKHIVQDTKIINQIIREIGRKALQESDA